MIGKEEKVRARRAREENDEKKAIEHNIKAAKRKMVRWLILYAPHLFDEVRAKYGYLEQFLISFLHA